MPRTARIIVPDYPFHITHRANNKQVIFSSNILRRKYLLWFQEASAKFGMRIIAYCLMDNHVHYVALPTQLTSFSKTIGSVHHRFSRLLNFSEDAVGHRWQERYFSCLLDQRHLLAAVRYVERNPVRAGMVAKPWDWPWSSAREHVHGQKGIITLSDSAEYIDVASWKEYIDVEESSKDLEEIRNQTFAGKAWADDEFKKQMHALYGVNLENKPVGRPVKGDKHS